MNNKYKMTHEQFQTGNGPTNFQHVFTIETPTVDMELFETIKQWIDDNFDDQRMYCHAMYDGYQRQRLNVDTNQWEAIPAVCIYNPHITVILDNNDATAVLFKLAFS